jgi:hypothetical protein
VQPHTFRLPHSGLTVPHLGYTVTAYTELKTDDGVAFTATLRLNGKIIGTVENEGVGGPDTFHPNDAHALRTQMTALETFAAACVDAAGTTAELDIVLGDLITEYQTGRDITRAAKHGHALLRMMQDWQGDHGPMGWAVETAITEAPPTLAADHARLRSFLLGSRELAAPALAWWQIWDAGARRWSDVTDRPAHLPADRY